MNQIVIGDCRETMRKWAAEGVKAQTCVTSPPYYGQRDYKVDGQIGLGVNLTEYVDSLVETFDCVWDVLTDDGTLWLNLGDSYASGGRTYRDTDTKSAARGMATRPADPPGVKPKDLIGVPWTVALALRDAGWHLRQEIIWSKPAPLPESVKDRCTRSHEHVFLLTKRKDYYFDSTAMQESTEDGLLRNKRSVWTVAQERFRGDHPAVFPAALISPCILAGSRPGDVVLDPFMGSGTTAAVALQHGRQYLGCELNPSYKELQDNRLSAVHGS